MKMESLVEIGIILIVIGFIAVVIGSLSASKDSKVAFGGFIGFVPFGFGNDKKMVLFVIAISAVIMIVMLFLNFKSRS